MNVEKTIDPEFEAARNTWKQFQVEANELIGNLKKQQRNTSTDIVQPICSAVEAIKELCGANSEHFLVYQNAANAVNSAYLSYAVCINRFLDSFWPAFL